MRVYLFLISFFCILGILGCNSQEESDSCEDVETPAPRTSQVTSIIPFSKALVEFQNEGDVKTDFVSTPISYSQYVIQVELLISLKNRGLGKLWHWLDNLFLPTVHACVLLPETVMEDRIVDIDIVSNLDYDADHPAGTSLKDIFTIFDKTQDNNSPENLQDYLKAPPIPSQERFYLFLKKPPATSDSFQFTITYQLERQTYEGTTTSVQISVD